VSIPIEDYAMIGDSDTAALVSNVFSWRDGAVVVAPTSSKEAVTHHVVSQQKKKTAKTTINRNFPRPNQMDLRSSGPVVSKSVVIRVTSVPAWVLAIMKSTLEPSTRATFSCGWCRLGGTCSSRTRSQYVVGTTVNPALCTTVAIKPCNIRQREITPPVHSETSATPRS
jgi:hypothetical protein